MAAARKRNIACLESMWDNRTENRLNVLPMLEVIARGWNVKVSHLTCNTREELKYNLNLLCKRNYGILYFAFHGLPGYVKLHGDKVSLAELAEMMSCRFSNWIIHFGTCGTIRRPKQVLDFVEQTKVALVTGFTKKVDWIESSAFELLMFQSFHLYKSPRIVCRNLFTKYPDLAELTGFKVFPEFI